MNSDNEHRHLIDDELLKELPHFELFFSRMGFKRIDGAIFGLLVLSSRPLTSEEIEATLALSQSAVSLSLKTLTHYGAIESRDQRDSKARLHIPKENMLSIVATIFRKREEEYVREFKMMAQRILLHSKKSEAHSKRMQSIIATCDMALTVMNTVMSMSEEYQKSLAPHIQNLALNKFKEHVTEKFKERFKGFTS